MKERKKLDCIFLIDDDESTNFMHKWVLKQADCAKQIVAIESSKTALEYLTSEVNDEHPWPNLIFLDINMPRMNGWEFIEEYSKISKEKKKQTVLVMLTTSINPDDRVRAKAKSDIKGFQNKPLTLEVIDHILKKHFSN